MYVGKTSRSLKQRISEHKSSIRVLRMKMFLLLVTLSSALSVSVACHFVQCSHSCSHSVSVACHFVQCSHSVSSLQFQGIEKVEVSPRGGGNDRKLCQRELVWIHTLGTLQLLGPN
ncbi:unnamed protein product [Coregonus sp. 'balchen']|nr:unnamed protein product [Coregonus sp. 'balchen']